MGIDVNEVEAIWIALTLGGVVLRVLALRDACRDRVAIRALNGRAREIMADGSVRREVLRLVVQLLLLSIVVPAILRPGPTVISVGLLVVIAIPAVLFVDSVLDTRERRRLTAIVLAPK